MKHHLHEASGNSFTVKKSTEKSLPFLDGLIKREDGLFNMQVYTKPTNPAHCFNGKSECPHRYRGSTTGAYI